MDGKEFSQEELRNMTTQEKVVLSGIYAVAGIVGAVAWMVMTAIAILGLLALLMLLAL